MNELTFWIVSAVVTWVGIGILWHFAKKDGENYVDMEDYR
jgi:hypothetical protein